MVEKKLLVNDEITACVKQICLLGVICKNSNKKYCLVKHFAFLKNVCYQFQIFPELTSVFNELLIGPQQLSWNVLLFSCNPIGQLCLSGPGYSSRTVIPVCDMSK